MNTIFTTLAKLFLKASQIYLLELGLFLGHLLILGNSKVGHFIMALLTSTNMVARGRYKPCCLPEKRHLMVYLGNIVNGLF